MEQINIGRTIIRENENEVEIIIPSPKNWFLIIFFGTYVTMHTYGIILFANELIINSEFLSLLLLIPILLFYTYFFRILLWSVLGKEIIKFTQYGLIIEMKNAFFISNKYYELERIKDLWVEREPASLLFMLYNKRKYINIGSFGLVHIQYGTEMIKCGASLNEIEANYIVSFLKEKNILKNN